MNKAHAIDKCNDIITTLQIQMLRFSVFGFDLLGGGGFPYV